MGFFSPGNTSKYYVGIMYNNPSNAVVWVANRDKPMNDSRGTIAISEDGNLVVLDGQKRKIWYSDVSEPLLNTTTAQLLDTGNLVLKDGSTGRNIWESFSNPSDCLLRTMKLGTKALRSWRSPSEPFPGSFSFGIQLLNIPQVVIWNNTELYWRSGPWNKQIFIGISQMGSYYNNGFDFTTDSDGNTSLSFDYKNYLSENLYLHLGSNGSLLQTYWGQGKEQWEVTWESHSSECDEYGKCRSFGICNPGGLQQVCSCLRGFKPKREVEWGNGNWSSGCVRKADLQCDRNNSDVNKSKKDGFLKLQMVKVPDFSNWVPSSLDTCETDCLKNCSCLAYSFYPGIGCMHWTGSLIDLQQFSMGGADVYIRLAYSELDLKKESKHKKVIIATTVTLGLLAIAISAYFCWGCLAKHRDQQLPRFNAFFLIQAWKMWNEERTEEVVDPRIYDRRFEMNMKRCVHVGLLCVQEYPEDRPNVSTVLSMLSSEIAELPGANKPAFTGRQSCPDTDSSKQSNLSVNSTTITVIEGR
nr:G-type lectin S-receptor-like serine/threonine-protein kinase At1g11330 [Ipomoea batatas]